MNWIVVIVNKSQVKILQKTCSLDAKILWNNNHNNIGVNCFHRDRQNVTFHENKLKRDLDSSRWRSICFMYLKHEILLGNQLKYFVTCPWHYKWSKLIKTKLKVGDYCWTWKYIFLIADDELKCFSETKQVQNGPQTRHYKQMKHMEI